MNYHKNENKNIINNNRRLKMKTFVKDLNLNQEELNATINLLKSIKEYIPICKHIIENYKVKNSVKIIISDLLNYTIDNLSKQLKSENNNTITKNNNKTNNKIIEKLRNRLLDENVYIIAQGDTFRVSKLLKDDNNKNISITDFINAEFKKRQSDNKKDDLSESEWVSY